MVITAAAHCENRYEGTNASGIPVCYSMVYVHNNQLFIGGGKNT